MLHRFRNRFLSKLVLLTCVFSFIATPLQAAVISTDDLVRQEQSRIDRQDLVQALERQDVRTLLISKGVDPQQARERVTNMTDAEIASLNRQIDEMPAGGILGAILLVMIILIFTDMAGWTDVYPRI